jgi:hypothetical protein
MEWTEMDSRSERTALDWTSIATKRIADSPRSAVEVFAYLYGINNRSTSMIEALRTSHLPLRFSRSVDTWMFSRTVWM